jgi:serine/threonine protein kinase
MSQPPTQLLGDFELVRELGHGGMGVVYEARQVSLNRRVALKVLFGGLGLTPKAVQRFHREAEAAARLHHTNIVPIYATGDQDGTHFYAMELVDGPSLDHVIRQARQHEASTDPAPPSDLAATSPYLGDGTSPTPLVQAPSLGSGSGYFDTVARLVAEVADALDYAHGQGVIHRDIKPSNLLLSPAGRLSVNDFGLARVLEQPGMTMTGEFVGTPAYMSPEQVTSGRIPLDHRTDIYSLGATLYELLTLSPPFTGSRRDQVLAQIIQKEPVPPRRLNGSVPRDLETICLKCLEKDPDRRYPTAKELAEDLRRYVNRFAILAKRAGPLVRLKKWVKRNPALSAAGFVVLLALTLAGLVAWRAYEAERQLQAQLLDEKRQAAIEKAIVSAMGGQLADADAALLEAERLGAGLAERRFVAGILSQYRGDAHEAKRLLLEACGERPDWLAPRAYLSVVCNYLEDWDAEVVHGNRALELSPQSPEDYLFRGYMVGFNNPVRGLPDLEEAWKRRPSVLAQFIRSEVLAILADDTGRVEDSVAAREALRNARSLMGDTPMVAVASLYIQTSGCNNCRLHGNDAEARQWLADGAADFRASETYHAHPGALQARAMYLWLRDGDTGPLDAENREAGRRSVDSSACLIYLASLFRRGKTDEALEYLRTVRDPGSDLLPFTRVALLIGTDLEAARAECRGALARGVGSRYTPYFCYALSLAGMPDEARKQAQAFREHPLPNCAWDAFQPSARKFVGRAYEGLPLDVETEIAGSRWKRFIAYDTLAFAALGRGEREEACSWFRKSAQHPPVFAVTHLFMHVLRNRLINDPDWPPGLVRAKK